MEAGYFITSRIDRDNEDHDSFGVAIVCAIKEATSGHIEIGRLKAAVFTPHDGYCPEIDGRRIVEEFDALSQDSYDLAQSLSEAKRRMKDEFYNGIVGIVSIEVDQAHRGRGIGRTMVRALRSIEQLDGHMIALQAKPIGKADHDMGDRLRRYHMNSPDVTFRSPSPRRDASLLVGTWSKAA